METKSKEALEIILLGSIYIYIYNNSIILYNQCIGNRICSDVLVTGYVSMTCIRHEITKMTRMLDTNKSAKISDYYINCAFTTRPKT